MVADPHVLITEIHARLCHLTNGVSAITPGTVHMYHTFDIGRIHQIHLFIFLVVFKLPEVLTVFRRDKMEIQFMIDLLFRFDSYRRSEERRVGKEWCCRWGVAA